MCNTQDLFFILFSRIIPGGPHGTFWGAEIEPGLTVFRSSALLALFSLCSHKFCLFRLEFLDIYKYSEINDDLGINLLVYFETPSLYLISEILEWLERTEYMFYT